MNLALAHTLTRRPVIRERGDLKKEYFDSLNYTDCESLFDDLNFDFDTQAKLLRAFQTEDTFEAGEIILKLFKKQFEDKAIEYADDEQNKDQYL